MQPLSATASNGVRLPTFDLGIKGSDPLSSSSVAILRLPLFAASCNAVAPYLSAAG